MGNVVESIIIQTKKEKTKWLDNVWVGRLENKGMFERVEEEMQGMFGMDVKPAYWGEDMVILHEMDDDTADKINQQELGNGGTPFSSIQKWTPELMPSYRLTWLLIWGVPLQAWETEHFATIVETCGELVELDAATEDKVRMDIARVLVRTKEKPSIALSVNVVVDRSRHCLEIREDMASGWSRTARFKPEEGFPPSPFSTEMDASDAEPNNLVPCGVPPERSSGDYFGDSPTQWPSPGMVETGRRCWDHGSRRWRNHGDPKTGDDVSTCRWYKSAHGPVKLTPRREDQQHCNGHFPVDLHGKGMPDLRLSCTSQNQMPFAEIVAAEKVKDVSEVGSIHRALEEYPVAMNSEEYPVVNHDSKLPGLTERDNSSQGLEGDGVKKLLGLENSGPGTNGGKTSFVFKVYRRKKECGTAKSTAQLNLNPVFNKTGEGGESEKLGTISKTKLNNEGGISRVLDTAPLTPTQERPSHSPISPSSFNNDYYGVEDDAHWEIARDLGLSFAENTTNMVKKKREVDSSCNTSVVAVEMGKHHHDA